MGFYGTLWVFMEIGDFPRLKMGAQGAWVCNAGVVRAVDKSVI